MLERWWWSLLEKWPILFIFHSMESNQLALSQQQQHRLWQLNGHKKNNIMQLKQHQTSWILFLFHVCQSFYWIQHLGEISSNMVLPFLLWTTEQVLWTIKSIVNAQMAKNGWWVCSKKNLDSWFSYFDHVLCVAIQMCTPVENGNGLQAYKHSWHISLKA